MLNQPFRHARLCAARAVRLRANRCAQRCVCARHAAVLPAVRGDARSVDGSKAPVRPWGSRSVRDVVAQATAFDPADRFRGGSDDGSFMYAVGVPVDFRKGVSLLIRVVRGALAIFGVAIRLPKQVARKIRIPAWFPTGWCFTVRQRWACRRFESRRRYAWCGRAGFVVRSARCIYVARRRRAGDVIPGFCAWRKSRLSMAVGVWLGFCAPLAFGRGGGLGYPAGRLGRGHGLRVRCLRHEPARGYGSFACGRLCGIVCVRLAGHGLADPVARRYSAAREAIPVIRTVFAQATGDRGSGHGGCRLRRAHADRYPVSA